MKRTKFLSVTSLATLCLFLSGILYSSCSNDEDSWDEDMQTLAESKMTRAGEGGSSGKVTVKTESPDSSVVYKEMNTTICQDLSIDAIARIHIKTNEGINSVIRVSATVEGDLHESYNPTTGKKIISVDTYLITSYFYGGRAYVEYTATISYIENSITKCETLQRTASAAPEKKTIANK